MIEHSAPEAMSRSSAPRPRVRNATLASGAFTALAVLVSTAPIEAQDGSRPRARDVGITVGVFETGEHNAITDVRGVRVGHTTVIEGPDVRTGVTAILPHGGNPYLSRVPAAIHVGNGYGKLLGVTQVRELGEMETPILLTCTLCVWKAADAMVEWMLARDGMENVRSLNALVGETNDGGLNDIRSRPITPEHVVSALESATDGPVEEGAIGSDESPPHQQQAGTETDEAAPSMPTRDPGELTPTTPRLAHPSSRQLSARGRIHVIA